MVLVHTTGTSLEGTTRDRVYRFWDSSVQQYKSNKYLLEQPDVHARYREAFSKIDILNKTAVGHGSLTRHIQTTRWKERYFYGLLSLSVSNAWKVGNIRRVGRGERALTIHTYLKLLGRKCLDNPLGSSNILLRPSNVNATNIQIAERIRHGLLVSSTTGNNPKCKVCRSRGTSIKCICGAPICNPRKHDCMVQHLLIEVDHLEWRDVRMLVLDARRG